MERATLHSEGATLRGIPSPQLPRFTAEPHTGRSLYLQVRDFLRQAMIRGDLPPGGRLPSTRVLSLLGVSRNTVMAAYEALAAEGLIQARIGSGTSVTVSVRRPKTRDLRFLLEHSHFPADPVSLNDPDGNPLYLHR